MAKYLHFETKSGAANRSKELWGGYENAVTQHLYEFVESPKDSGGSFLIVPDDGGELTAEEKNKLQGFSEFKEWMDKYLAPE
tara:strand:- start:297 stop:542 length:246 start_codon:yes stop_codon:yes gene_type:complete